MLALRPVPPLPTTPPVWGQAAATEGLGKKGHGKRAGCGASHTAPGSRSHSRTRPASDTAVTREPSTHQPARLFLHGGPAPPARAPAAITGALAPSTHWTRGVNQPPSSVQRRRPTASAPGTREPTRPLSPFCTRQLSSRAVPRPTCSVVFVTMSQLNIN